MVLKLIRSNHNQKFPNFHSFPSDTKQLQCVDVNNPLQKVFKCVYTVYTYWNCTINQLLYRWQITLVNKAFVASISNTWYDIVSCPDFRSEVSFFLSALLFLQSRYLKISKFRHHHIDVVIYHEKYVIKYAVKLFNLAG